MRPVTTAVCQHCSVNPATIHYTELREDERIELHVCEECALEQGLSTETAVLGMGASLIQASMEAMATENRRCPDCGITFKEFRRRGRLGCPRDYEVFADALIPMIEKMHGGASKHVGRISDVHAAADAVTLLSAAIRKLKRRMHKAIRAEQYEEAASLRDEIVEHEQRLQRETEGDEGTAEATDKGDA